MAKELTYEKVNQKIDKLSVNIQKVVAAYKKLEAQGKSASEINKILAKDIEKVTRELNSASNATLRYGKQTSTADDQRKKANSSLKDAFAAHERLTGAINKTREAEERASKSNKSFGDGIRSAFSPASIGSAIGNVAKFVGVYTAITTVVSAIKDVIVGSVQSFVEYENSIATLVAVTGATAEETKLLSESIRESALQTRFSATEIANLSIELAKLGATSDEIPDLILPISNAAQAIGADLASVGEAIFKVNNQFGLSSAEAAATAQTLVSAVNESALSLESFSTAIQYVGPVADQVGLSFSETASYLQVLSDSGFSASRIGTGLRKIFIDLKKPGEDITTTIENLAEKNISLSEANELVGRTAAAQLITLLQNTDSLRENSDASTALTSSLKASAAQMSTTSGIVDVLRNSYEDLKISIGGALTNSEAFIEVIGFLFPKAEELIRGYTQLNEIFSTKKGSEIAKAELKALADDAIATGSSFLNVQKLYASTLKILSSTGKLPELTTLLEKLTSLGFDYAQAQNLIEIATKDGQWALAEFVTNLGKGGKTLQLVGKAFKETGLDLDELGDKYIQFQGFTKIIQGQAEEVLKSVKISNERNKVFDSYAKTLERIKSLGTTETANVAAIKEEVDVRKKLTKAQQQLNEEKSKGILANEEEVLRLTGTVSGYEKVLNALSELGVVDEEEAKKAKKLRETRAKSTIDDIRLRNDSIKDELNRIKELRNEEIAIARERSKLLLENQELNAQERLKIETDLENAILAANERAVDLTDKQLQKFKSLMEDSAKAVKTYGKEFPDLVDNISSSLDSVKDIFDEIANSVNGSLVKTSQDAIDKSKAVIQTWKTQIDTLNEKYGESAGKSKEYFKELAGITDESTIALMEIADGLDRTTEEGKIAFIVIQQLISKIEGATKGKKTDWKKFWREIFVDTLNESLDIAIDSVDRFNEVALQNTKDRLAAERDAIQNQYDIEEEILKAKLEGQLITESEYRAQVEKNRKQEIQAQNRIDKQIFDAEQKRDRQKALLDYLSAVGSIVPELIKSGNAEPVALAIKSAITAGLATISYSTELKAINQRKFYPTKFAEGGIVNGPSHAEGGVPFTVRGQGGYEMEGGEYIVNKKATQKYKVLLDQINGYGKSSYKFAAGGVVKDPTEVANRQIELLEAIASSNISMVGKLDKPVRAFVATSDLRSDENARRIQERNSQL